MAEEGSKDEWRWGAVKNALTDNEMQRCGQDRETAGRQERKIEQEMLRFPLDVRCVSVPGMLSCCPHSLRVRQSWKKGKSWLCEGTSEKTLLFCFFRQSVRPSSSDESLWMICFDLCF